MSTMLQREYAMLGGIQSSKHPKPLCGFQKLKMATRGISLGDSILNAQSKLQTGNGNQPGDLQNKETVEYVLEKARQRKFNS